MKILLIGLLIVFWGIVDAAQGDSAPTPELIKPLLLNKIHLQRDNFVEFISNGKNFSHSKGHGFAKFWDVNWKAQQKWCNEIVQVLGHRPANLKPPKELHAIDAHVVDWEAEDSFAAYQRKVMADQAIKPVNVVTATILFPALDNVIRNGRMKKRKYISVTARLTGTPPYSGIFPDYFYDIPIKNRPKSGLTGGLPQDPTQHGLVQVKVKPDGSNIGSIPWGDEGMPTTDDYSQIALVSYRGEPLFIEYGVYPRDWLSEYPWTKLSKKQRAQERWGRAGQGYVLVNGINKNLFASDWVLSEPPYPLGHGARPLISVVMGEGEDAVATSVPPERSDYLYACIVNFDILRK